jgi:hypothetical protein
MVLTLVVLSLLASHPIPDPSHEDMLESMQDQMELDGD